MFKHGGRVTVHTPVTRLCSSDSAPFLHLWKDSQICILWSLEVSGCVLSIRASHVVIGIIRDKITFLDAFS